MGLLSFFYVITVSGIITKNPFWLLISFVCFSKKQLHSIIPGIFLGLLTPLFSFKALSTQTINCNKSGCYLSAFPLNAQNLKISNIPDRYYGLYTGAVTVESKSNILPITKQILKSVNLIETKNVYSTQTNFIDPLQRGLNCRNNFDKIFLYGGWAHYFCFSGWHCHTLLKMCYKNKYIFATIGIYINIFLGLSFPFLRSFIETLLSNRAYSWPLSLLILPLAPLSMSFWLTLYYQHLMKNCIVNNLTLSVTSLALNQIFMGKINVIIFIFFQMLHSKIATELLLYILIIKIIFLNNLEGLSEINKEIEYYCGLLINTASIYIQVPETLCYLILTLAASRLKMMKINRRKDLPYF